MGKVRLFDMRMAFLSNTGRVRVRTRRLLLHARVWSRRLLLHLRDRSRSILSFFKRLIAETPFQTSATDRADYFSNTGVWSPGIDRQVKFLDDLISTVIYVDIPGQCSPSHNTMHGLATHCCPRPASVPLPFPQLGVTTTVKYCSHVCCGSVVLQSPITEHSAASSTRRARWWRPMVTRCRTTRVSNEPSWRLHELLQSLPTSIKYLSTYHVMFRCLWIVS